MIGTIPPVGVPIDWSLILKAGSDKTAEFEKELGSRLGGEVFLVNSGRTALYLVLKAARLIMPSKNEVIIPDYTCWSVPSAVTRAGLKVRPVDIEAENLGLSPAGLECAIEPNTLAVVVTHLFGIPSKIDRIERICAEKNVLLIDDAAQGLGASLDKKPLGSYGDAGVLSFGRGKNITTISGGALVVRNNLYLKKIREIFQSEFFNERSGLINDKTRLAAYKIMFNRMLYWIPDSLRFFGLGETIYDPDFNISRLSPYRSNLGAEMILNINELIRLRGQKAEDYRSRLEGTDGLKLPTPPENGEPHYLRLPILLRDRKAKLEVLKTGHKMGISPMYPDTVTSIRDLGIQPGEKSSVITEAKKVSDTLITLPTHHDIKKGDITRIVALVKRTVSATRQ